MTADNDWQGIWVFLEQVNGAVENVSWEMLGKAHELAGRSGQEVTALLLGKGVKGLAEEAVMRGANHVLIAERDCLERYTWEAYTKVITDMVNRRKPSILLLGATHNGVELAGRLAVRLNTGLTADVVRLDINSKGLLLSAVPGFGGLILAIIKCEQARPQMSTVRPGIFSALEPDASRKGKVESVRVDIDPKDIGTRLIENVVLKGEDISNVERLIAAGRGTGGNLKAVRELADMMDAGVGVTRPIVDMGLMPRSLQVGSTGVSVKPKLTLIAGASGAFHFVSGIQDSETIISINNDPNAQIFQYSDYCVVGDVNKILPAVIKELKARIARGEM